MNKTFLWILVGLGVWWFFLRQPSAAGGKTRAAGGPGQFVSGPEGPLIG